MSRSVLAFLLISVCLGWSTPSAAEPEVIRLWPGTTPGDTGIEEEEYSRFIDVVEFPGVGRQKVIEKVSTPTLTVYRVDPDKNTGTAMLICPGGGYHRLFWEVGGEEVAAWLNSVGMTGIILKYRCPRREGENSRIPPLGPLLDAQRAMSLIRSRAQEWGIDRQRIGIVGFSAGGHLAIATATEFGDRKYELIDAIDEISCRPDFAIGNYSGYLKEPGEDEIYHKLRIPKDTAPIFLTHATDDTYDKGGSSPEDSALMYIALKRAGIPVELHIFGSGSHSYGVRQRDNFLPSSWPNLCLKWLRSHELYPPEPTP